MSCCFAVLVVALALGGSLDAVGADDSTEPGTSISFPLTTVRGEPGTVHEIISSDLPADLVGLECSATASAENNESVHPQTDLIVTSGSDQIVIRDVEATPGTVTTAEGTLTLASTLTISVRLEPDVPEAVFSGGGSVDLVCAQPAPTTTTTTTTQPPAPVEDVTVTQPVVAQAVAVTPNVTG